ncbi:MAG: DNA gyrase subunit A, partial [Terriglobia bacterium]
EKKIEGISDIRDESDRDGMRIVFELKRGEQAEVILNNLYKHTEMQTSFGMILLAVHNGQPRELGLAEAIKVFIDHRTDVGRRRTQFDLKKAREREHILLGYQIALDNLDAVIKLIRASKNPAEAREGLITSFALSEIQAKAILDMQLQRLTALEREKILEELREIRKRIQELEEILASERKLKNVIVHELREVQKDYGDKRRTEIIQEQAEISLEDLIPVEDVAVTVSHQGYLKRTPVTTYRQQARGVRAMTLGKGDYLVGMEVVGAVGEEGWILTVTENGYGKRTEIDKYRVQSRGGKGIINLKTTEAKGKVVGIIHVTDQSEVIIITQQGKLIRIESSDIRSAGRSTQGVRLLRIEPGEGDRIAAACLIPESEENSNGEDEKPPLVQ